MNLLLYILVCVCVSFVKSKYVLLCFQVLGYEQIPQNPVSDQPDQISSVCKEVDKHKEILQKLLQGSDFNNRY